MSNTQHEFADSESVSFLHGEAKEMPVREGFLGRKILRWTLWSRISRFLPYMLLMVGIFSIIGLFVSSKESQEKHLLPSQTMFGKSTSPMSLHMNSTTTATFTSKFFLADASLVSKKITIFNPDESFNVDPFGPDEMHGAWSKLIPPGKGHIRVEKPAAWQLSGGFPLGENAESETEEYTVSLFHQLHCLAAIKSRMALLQDWYTGENDKEYLSFALNDDPVAAEHIYHCFDYIRQAIMCNGDTTLERGRTVDGKVVRGVDGWGIAHECRDYDAIYTFAAEHRSRNLTGID